MAWNRVQHRGDVTFGCINIHSAVNRAALVHTVIADHRLDMLALQETWITMDDPDAIRNDISAAWYSVLNVHRPSPTGSDQGHRQGRRPAARGGGRPCYRLS